MKKSHALLVFMLAVLGGCAASVKSDLVPQAGQAIAEAPLTRNVQLARVAGGDRTSRLQLSVIDNKDFSRALRNSLAASSFLANGAGGKYVLTADIQEVVQPPSGVDMTVSSVVRYLLVRAADGKELLNETITSPYKTELDDSHALHERVKSATEGAARSSIAQLIGKLNALRASRDGSAIPR